jgi:hypothetical protein
MGEVNKNVFPFTLIEFKNSFPSARFCLYVLTIFNFNDIAY